ncbi:MAG: hypothetical protein U0996_13490 [Planctomycetaceae bacterium]
MTSNNPQTWLVIFDRLSHGLIAANSSSDDGTIVFRPFDWLEVHSLVFEQFHRQDFEDLSNETYPFASVVDELTQKAQLAGRRIQTLNLRDSNELPRERVSDLTATDIVVIRLHNAVGDDALAARENADSLLSCVLDELLSLQTTSSSNTAKDSRDITLIVTASRGITKALPDSFDSALNQSSVHVPLWIYSPSLPARRSQVVCGSRDLAPTLAEVTGLPLNIADQESAKSLLELANEENAERILELNGPGWRALRTATYLLVIRDADLDADESPDVSNSDPVRRLYLKPDDYWNVNDVYASYEEIAKLLEETASNS